MDAARSISDADKASSGWVIGAACHARGALARLAGALGALTVLVVLSVSTAGWTSAAGATPRSTQRSHAEGGDVSCPARLAGVPLATDVEFAGTPRALANDEGVLVRFSLLCPYRRPAEETSAAELTLVWSMYAADDLKCRDLELTSESADGDRVQGALDHPTLSARVTYGAASADLLPAVDNAATKLLAAVPQDAYPCVGGAATGVDASVAPPTTRETSSSVAVLLVVGVLAGSAALLVVVTMLVRRTSRRRREVMSAPDPDYADLRAAMKRRAQGGGTPGAAAAAPPAPPPPPAGNEAPGGLFDQRQQHLQAHTDAVAAERAISDALSEVRRDVTIHRAHAAAVRQLAESFRADASVGYQGSYAGLMTLAVAATNLVSTSARRAASLLAPTGVSGEVIEAAAHLDAVQRQILVAAEDGLDDSRYWLWQDRRVAVVDALGALQRLAPRQAALQQALAVRVGQLVADLRAAQSEVARNRSALAELDRQIAGAPEAPGLFSGKPLQRTGA